MLSMTTGGHEAGKATFRCLAASEPALPSAPHGRHWSHRHTVRRWLDMIGLAMQLKTINTRLGSRFVQNPAASCGLVDDPSR